MNILSFLLLSTTLSLVAFSSSDTNVNVISTPVLDREGKSLKINEEYVINSIAVGGGSVYLDNIKNRTKCPQDVLHGNSGSFYNSTAVLFYTMQLGSLFVSENQDVSIMFSTSSVNKSCVNETVWQAGHHRIGPIPSPPRFVITGATLGFPGPNNIQNWFKIVKYETGRPHSYKLRYCPSKFICPTCQVDCADVGLYKDSGRTRLVLNDETYAFGFSKVNNHLDA